MKIKTIGVAIALMILLLGYAFSSFIHMNRKIKYESLYDPQCSFEEKSRSLYFSFVFVDSFLSITDYELIQKKEGDRTHFYITLIGRNVANPKDIILEKDIQKKGGRIEVLIPQTSFDARKDEFYYKVNGKTYRINVSIGH